MLALNHARIAVGLTLAMWVSPVGASPPAPLSFLPLTPARCSTGCVARAAGDGALLCLDHLRWATEHDCTDGPEPYHGQCRAAWIRPRAPVPSFTFLAGCDYKTFELDAPSVARFNDEAAAERAELVTPIFQHGPFEVVPLPVLRQVGDTLFALDATHLRVTRNGRPLDHVPWQPATRVLASDAATVRVYAIGQHDYLVSIAYDGTQAPLWRSVANRWVMLGETRDRSRDPTPLPEDPELASLFAQAPFVARSTAVQVSSEGHGPSRQAQLKAGHIGLDADEYGAIAPYLEKVCDRSLTSNHLAALRASAADTRGWPRGATIPGAGPGPSAEALKLLFNMHGAMHGHAFKTEPWLNDFFYGPGDWLPEPCRELVRRYPRRDAIPSADTKMRDQVKGLWDEVRAR